MAKQQAPGSSLISDDLLARDQFDTEPTVDLLPLLPLWQPQLGPAGTHSSAPPAAAVSLHAGNGIGSAGSLLLVAGLAHNSGPALAGATTNDDSVAGRAIDTAAIASLSAAIDGGGTLDETGLLGAGGHFRCPRKCSMRSPAVRWRTARIRWC